MSDIVHGFLQCPVIQPFLIQDHVGFNHTAAAAMRHAIALYNVVQIIKLSASGTVIPMYTAVKLQHLPASRHLVEAVNVLGNDRLKLPPLLQPGQGLVGLVWDSIGKQHPVLIKSVEFLRIPHIKAMAYDGLRRVLILLVIEPVHTAEIRNPAFRGYSGSAKEHNVITAANPFL